MRISEAARLAGMSASAIRFYERRGLMPSPRRTNGIRHYDEEDLDRLVLITFYRSCGVSIGDLASLLSTKRERRFEDAHATASRRLAELDDVISRARAMQRRLRALQECDCRGDRKRCIVYNGVPRRPSRMGRVQ